MKKKTIICVDDEKIVLDSLKKELRSSFGTEFDIEVAESGAEAVELFHELISEGIEVPLVITDYIMPEMKGDEVLRQTKALSPSIYNILLTGQATIEGVANAINFANLYRFIPKPWIPDDLSLTVSEALKSYDKDMELEKRRREIEEANAKLLKLDTAKTYFLGLLSHELNTPLIGINGNAKLIAEITDDPDIKESAESILASEARLRKFSELSLLITRIQTDKYHTAFTDESLIDIVESGLFNFKDRLSQKQVEVIKHIPFEDCIIKADFNLISRVFDIVLDNAVKYTPVDTSITIKMEKQNSFTEISISDMGAGFSDASLEHLFEAFVSTDDLMSHSEGTGLSLAAAKVITELHGYDIKASNSQTGGAEVRLIFNNKN